MNLLRLREQSPRAAEQMPEAEEQTPEAGEQTPEAEEQTPEAEETGTCGGGCSYLPHHGLRSPCIYCLPLLHESRLEQLHKSAWTMDLFPFLKLSLGRSVLDPCNLFPDFGSVPYPPPPSCQNYRSTADSGRGEKGNSHLPFPVTTSSAERMYSYSSEPVWLAARCIPVACATLASSGPAATSQDALVSALCLSW